MSIIINFSLSIIILISLSVYIVSSTTNGDPNANNNNYSTTSRIEENHLILDPLRVCRKNYLVKNTPVNICHREVAVIPEVIKGVQLATRECHLQFRNRKWNCTTSRRSLSKVLAGDTAETGFVNSVSAAAITFIVTRACSMGHLKDCSCGDSNIKGKPIETTEKYEEGFMQDRRITYDENKFVDEDEEQNTDENRANGEINKEHVEVDDGNLDSSMENFKQSEYLQQRLQEGEEMKEKGTSRIRETNEANSKEKDWKWGGCSDNVSYGSSKSRIFLDLPERGKSDIKSLVKLHNTKTGRLTVEKTMKVVCKCHGITGACTIKTCWRKLSTFREVGNALREKYDSAIRVISSNNGRSFLPVNNDGSKSPSSFDLVYTEDSADFCNPDRKTGLPGTSGRRCNETSAGPDGCQSLCCGRGYITKHVREKSNCHCKFVWCCQIVCDTCVLEKRISTCN